MKVEWGTTENNREAKYYRLTSAGQKALAAEIDEWTRFTAAVGLVIVAEA